MKLMVFIGVDDTDVLGGPGTGRVARGIAEYLESFDLGVSKGIIRHQLLVDPRIRYTSHNSSKCIIFETEHDPLELAQKCTVYIMEHFQSGSDPGICIAAKTQVEKSIIDFGHRAQNEYLTKRRAIELAKQAHILLVEIGGTGEGIIGALAAVGLTANGNDGRFVQLRGIKEIEGLVTVAQVKTLTDTVAVIDETGKPVPDTETIDSLGWLRPSLINGHPVLRVRQVQGSAGKRIWEPVERRHEKHDGKGES